MRSTLLQNILLHSGMPLLCLLRGGNSKIQTGNKQTQQQSEQCSLSMQVYGALVVAERFSEKLYSSACTVGLQQKTNSNMLEKQIQSLNIHRWLIKLRNRETTLNRCVNKTCVGFFHFDIVITICAIVHLLFEHGGSWQRWGFDSQFFCIFTFLYSLFLYLYFYIFHLCICTCNCVHTNCSST